MKITPSPQGSGAVTKGPKPDFQLWLVLDQGDKKARWIKLSGLWPTKDGEGLTGQLQPHMIVPAGARLVILPPKADDVAAEGEAS